MIRGRAREDEQQTLSEVDSTARGSTSGATSHEGAARSSTWWPFETDSDVVRSDSRPGSSVVTSSTGRRRSLSDWFRDRDWQRLADVLLVGALLVTLGVTAKVVLDHSGANGVDTGDALSGDRRDEGLTGSLTAGGPGNMVTSRVTANGTVVVKQRLLTPEATNALTLSHGLESRAAESDGGTVVQDLTVSVGGRPVEVTQTSLKAGELTEVVLDASASEFLLSYVVEGAVTTSDASASGRALVELTTLGAEESTGPKVVRVRAGETGTVLSVACGPTLSVAQPCGRQGSEGWSVRLVGADTDTGVFASVDLPTS